MIFAAVASFICGAGAGCGITYYYMKKHYCDKKIDEGINDYILHRYNSEGGVAGDFENEAAGDVKEGEDSENETNISSSSIPKYQTPLDNYTPYEKYFDNEKNVNKKDSVRASNGLKNDGSVGEVADSEKSRGSALEGDAKASDKTDISSSYASLDEKDWIEEEIVVIDEDSYGKCGYKTAKLRYWLWDNVISDKNDEELVDPERVIGNVITDKWLGEAEDNSGNGTIFFRNHPLRMDYCLTTVDDSYYDRTLGDDGGVK